MRSLKTAGFLCAMLLAASACLAAEAPAPDALIQEFLGQAPAVQRSDADLQTAYGQALASLLPKLGTDKQMTDAKAGQTLIDICFRASRPGAAKERAALCRALVPLLAGGTPDQARLFLLMQLERIGGAECVPAAEGLLGDKDALIRQRALRVLQTNPDASAGAALRKALDAATEPEVRIAMMNALAYRRDAASVPAIARLAGLPHAATAAAAVDALATIGTREAAQALATVKTADMLRPTLDYARVKCADGLAKAGDAAGAETVYLALSADGQPARTRSMGLRGLVAIKSEKALPLLLACLDGADTKLQLAAAGLCAGLRDPAAAEKLLAAYPKLSVATQTALLSALAQRGDAGLLPVAVQALKSEDGNLRAAAIRAVGALGDARAVQPLVEMASATADRGVKQAAHDCLVRLRGVEVDKEITRLTEQGAPDVRVELMSVLVDRRSPEAERLLMAAAQGTEPKAAAEALKSLARVASADREGDILKLLLASKDEQVRSAAQDALTGIARRMPGPDQAAEPVLAAFAGADTDNKCALIELLASIGGEKALAAITAATKDADAEVKRAAVAALADNWEDAKPLPALLDLAKGETDKPLRVQALRGYIRLLALGADARPDETVKKLEEAIGLAQRPEEKKQALSVLRLCRVPAALTLAKKCQEDPALATEATAVAQFLAAPPEGGQGMPDTLPAPWAGRDIGKVGAPGSATLVNGKFTLKGAGADIQNLEDGFHFVYQPLAGDGSIVARVANIGNTNPWAKSGVMIRAGLKADAPNVYVCITPGNDASWQTRTAAGAKTAFARSTDKIAAPYWTKITRAGDTITGYVSKDGIAWQKIGEGKLPLPKEALIGVAVTSHKPGTATQSVVEQVAVK